MINEKNYIVKTDSFWSELTKIYADWAKENGMEYYEFSVLYEIFKKERTTQKSICDTFGYPKQSVSRVAINLCEKGFIKFSVSEKDRREKEMILTEKGKLFADKKLTSVFKAEKAVFEKIGEKRISEMLETAKMLSDFMKKELCDENQGRIL